MNTRSLVYLDNNATTTVDPAARDAMLPLLGGEFGNPSSPYSLARAAAAALARAREQVAGLLGAAPDEITFTGCGTESNNTALHAMLLADPRRRHLVLTRVEHPSVLNFAKHIENMGFRVSWLDVDARGQIDLNALRGAVIDETCGVSVMAANNETGVLFPVAEAAAIAHERGALFHTDAVQAAGKIVVDAKAWGVDFLSVSGHKFHAPKGVGALYVRSGVPFLPYIIGGEQESGRRAGTENVAGIAGLGVAAELAVKHLGAMEDRIRPLRDRLERELLARLPDMVIVGGDAPRLPNTSLLLVDRVESEALLALLDMDGICCSSGSACASGAHEVSHVLRAMGLPSKPGVLRVSLGRFTTADEMERLLDALGRHVAKLRK